MECKQRVLIFAGEFLSVFLLKFLLVNFKTFNFLSQYSGSPFHPKVTDPRKVRVVGGHVPGMGDNGIINMTHRKAYLLELSTAEAGPGKSHSPKWFDGN